jgi:hypothetical protein
VSRRLYHNCPHCLDIRLRACRRELGHERVHELTARTQAAEGGLVSTRIREVGRIGVARHVGRADGIDGDGVDGFIAAAAEVGGEGEAGARRIQHRDKAVRQGALGEP